MTGGAGVLGRALIAQLGDARLYCLVRQSPVSGRHVSPLAGDITRPRLGLTRSEYNEVAGRIDLVLHAAAITDFEQQQPVTMRTNVQGTVNVIELAKNANVPLYYIGTAFSDTKTSIASLQANDYELSKRHAEALVRASGIPHVILRPSIIVGNSTTGAISRFQGFHYVLGLLVRGLLPIGFASTSTYIDFVPQDVVACVIAGLIARGDTSGDHWITAGDQALTLPVFIDICLAHIRRRTGRQLARPRTYSPEVFDRLIGPVFMPALPAALRETFERAIKMARYINIEQPFPSALPQLAAELNIALPSAPLTLTRNIDHWLRCNATTAAVPDAHRHALVRQLLQARQESRIQ